MAQVSKVKRLAFDAGWMRYGWPERVGGFAGSTLLRAYLGEALTARDLVQPGLYSMTEVLAPTMIDYAAPELAAAMVPALLRGDETWCQGFSEPGTGSNLASLSCRAVRTDRRLAGHRAEGLDQPGPVRTALRPPHPNRDAGVRPPRDHRPLRGHGLARNRGASRSGPCTGATSSRRSSSMTWSSPSTVPSGRKGTAGRWPWTSCPTSAAPHCGTGPPSSTAGSKRSSIPPRPTPSTRPGSGEVIQLLYAFRARSRATQYRMAAGEELGPETSIDKVLLATTEQAVFDLVADVLTADVMVGDDPDSDRWRTEYLYSRAASIYGGSAEIQRNIIARRLLDLGDDR